MNNKIPCGGFYLSDTLGVDENGKLGVNGGEPYKSLVTDGEGNVKWEDRLAYEDSRVAVEVQSPLGEASIFYVKVADEIPEWVSIDAPIRLWFNNGHNITVNPKDYLHFGNESFIVTENVIINAVDNTEFNLDDILPSDMSVSFVLPEKGVYFSFMPAPAHHAVGIAPSTSDTPEITWDGNIKFPKTIDPKFIPSELNEIILPSSTPSSTKKFKITVNDNGAITATEV